MAVGTSSFPSSSILVSACRTLLLLTISTAVLRLRHWRRDSGSAAEVPPTRQRCHAPSPPPPYLWAGQLGLCQHQGRGVDGVSQLLLHQLVGLGCLSDPGGEGGSLQV